MAPSILVFSASLRDGSFNTKLAAVVERLLREKGAEVSRLDLAAFPLPIYDANLQDRQGFPAEAQELHRLFAAHRGIFIATPEYNAGVPPLLSNVIAWVSRIKDHGGQPAAFGKPVFALGAASPGVLGGYRGLMALRQSLELGLGARVLPAMISISAAGEAFDDEGNLKNQRSKDVAAKLADALVAATQA